MRRIKKLAHTVRHFTARRKITSGVIVAGALFSAYWAWGALFGGSADVRYVTARVEKGIIVSSLSATGQVSASTEIQLKPKASGDVVYAAPNSRDVAAGTLLVQLDARDAQKAVRDAEVNLASARLALEKIQKPADDLSLLQADHALTQATQAKTNAHGAIKKAEDDGLNAVSNAFLDLPGVIAGLQDMLFSSTLGAGQQYNIDFYSDSVKTYDTDGKAPIYRQDAYDAYQKARRAYDRNFADYKASSRFSDSTATTALINETYDTTKAIAESVKTANNFVQFYQQELLDNSIKPNPLSTTHLTSLNTYTGKTNSHLSSLLEIKQMITDNEENLANADGTIAERTVSLKKLRDGADPLDIESQQLAVTQRENALRDAQETLNNYFIRAQFDGTFSGLSTKRGDAVSASTVLGTLITKQKLANVSLNEVDVAKIKTGQKATLTFDAIPDLAITGTVAEFDAIGTVTQGVVTYNVKIAFDTQDERVKSGMSITAAIITDVKQDVLMVPNSAVKTQGSTHTVQIVDDALTPADLASNATGIVLKIPPRSQAVGVGLGSDEAVEITTGLKEGDRIVVRAIQPAAAATPQATAPSGGLRIPGLGGGDAGNIRGGGR
jgi:HlyD family secretion protein